MASLVGGKRALCRIPLFALGRALEIEDRLQQALSRWLPCELPAWCRVSGCVRGCAMRRPRAETEPQGAAGFPQRLPRDVIEQMLADALKMSAAHSFVNQVVLEAGSRAPSARGLIRGERALSAEGFALCWLG